MRKQINGFKKTMSFFNWIRLSGLSNNIETLYSMYTDMWRFTIISFSSVTYFIYSLCFCSKRKTPAEDRFSNPYLSTQSLLLFQLFLCLKLFESYVAVRTQVRSEYHSNCHKTEKKIYRNKTFRMEIEKNAPSAWMGKVSALFSLIIYSNGFFFIKGIKCVAMLAFGMGLSFLSSPVSYSLPLPESCIRILGIERSKTLLELRIL